MLKISSILSAVATAAVVIAAHPSQAETVAAYAQRYGWGCAGPFRQPGVIAMPDAPNAMNRESGPDRYLSVLPSAQFTDLSGVHQKPQQLP